MKVTVMCPNCDNLITTNVETLKDDQIDKTFIAKTHKKLNNLLKQTLEENEETEALEFYKKNKELISDAFNGHFGSYRFTLTEAASGTSLLYDQH